MKHRRIITLSAALAVAALLVTASLPFASADVLAFPDGFIIQGQVKEKMTFLATPDGAFSMPKPGVPFWLDDGFRRVWFPPFKLKDASKDRAKDPEQVTFKFQAPKPNSDLPRSWVAEKPGDWNERWERQVPLTVPGAKLPLLVTQRITSLTPESIRIEGVNYKWEVCYSTKEFDPQTLRNLVYWKLDKDKALKDKELEKRVTVYRFLVQAGYVEHAEKELQDMLKTFPQQASEINGLLDRVRRIYALRLVEAIQRAQKAGLHSDVENRLAAYAKHNVDDLVGETTQLQIQAIKDKYAAMREKIKDAGRLLQDFAAAAPPGMRNDFMTAAQAILSELNPDTIDRLATFLSLAADYERAQKDNRKPDQRPEEIMAFALTGWVRGNGAAERDVAVAFKQWKVRDLILEYMRSDDPIFRKNKLVPALAGLISVEEAMQVIRLLPPIEPFDKLDGKLHQLQTNNDGQKFSYAVQLPPGYHHGRTWPVMIALHHSQEKADTAAARWAWLAAEQGYIVVAPQWGQGDKSTYQFSTREHLAVLETLRDLRRRFQVDSDRVFLFGAEQGATMAFDVGLAHPDQFAGIMPMSGTPIYFGRRYWPNARHVNVYMVNGELAGASAKENYSMFMDLSRGNFPALYIEYKGRPAEWFGSEAPILFDWMNRKRRDLPLKELGKQDEEFKSNRAIDNQFYWLTAQINPQNINVVPGWNNNVKPATLRATVFTNNEIHVRTTGVNQVTVWFVPNLVNYAEPVAIRVNGSAARKLKVTPDMHTLLETLHVTGDRQRMYLARLDLKP